MLNWNPLTLLTTAIAVVIVLLSCGTDDGSISQDPADTGGRSDAVAQPTETPWATTPAGRSGSQPTTGAKPTEPASIASQTTSRNPAATPVGTEEPASATTGQPSNPSADQTALPAPSGDQVREANALLAKAEYYLQAERYRRAIKASDEVIAIQPNFARAYALRGSAHNELREFDSALRDLDEAIRLDPSRSGPAYSMRAEIYTELGDYDQAIEDAEIGLTAAVLAYQNIGRPDDLVTQDLSAAINGLAGAFFRSGKFSDFSSHFSNHLHSIEGYRGSLDSSAYNRSHAHKLESAHDEISTIDTKLILEPNNYRLYMERGKIYDDIGWYEKAIDDYNKGFVGHPSMTRSRLAISPYIKIKRYDEAYTLIKSIEALHRGTGGTNDPIVDIQAASWLAYRYITVGRNDEALRVMTAFDISNYEPDQFYRGLSSYVESKSLLLALNGEIDKAETYVNALYCAAKVHKCTYPAELEEDRFQDWFGSEIRVYGLPSYLLTVLDDFAIGADDLDVQRYLSLTFLHIPFPRSGFDRLDSARELLELDAQASDAYLNLALAHFEFAAREIKNARDAGTAQPMESHYQQATDALDRYEQLADARKAWVAELRLAEVHRELAIQHLRTADNADKDYQLKHLGLAKGAFESQERLGNVDEEFAGNYFAHLGAVFAKLGQKQEAQDAYKAAYDYGFDRRSIEEALSRLAQQ